MPEGTVHSLSTNNRAETKHERFLRLATGRVQRALDAIEIVGRLSSAENEYDEHEAQRIVSALQERLDDVERRLAHQKPQKKVVLV